MQTRVKMTTRVQLAILAMGVGCAGNASAGGAPAFSEMIVFGDSTVDSGNLFIATGGGVGGEPYFDGRFTNGQLWIEVLANQIGLPAPEPSLAGGTNYAWGGAASGDNFSVFETPNVGLQIQDFLGDRESLSGDELIIISAGANDILWEPPVPPARIAANIQQHIEILAAVGGRSFLVAGIAPYAQSPGFRGTPAQIRIARHTLNANRRVRENVSLLEQDLEITIYWFDWAGVVNQMLDSPADFELNNVTEAACPDCGLGVPQPGAGDTLAPNPENYLWWDIAHFTAGVHQVLGTAAADLLEAPAP